MNLINNPLKFSLFIVLLITGISSGLFSCKKNTYGAVIHNNRAKGKEPVRIVDANNAFGFELFKIIRESAREENLLVSPLSISVALAMAYNGAGADTKAEMENAMKLAGLTREQVNEIYSRLLSGLHSQDSSVTFDLANAIYFAEGFSANPDFVALNQKVYEAKVGQLDFSSPAAVKTINNWVKDKTNGKIDEIIQQLKPSDRMVLLNAIYFYGSWSREFDKRGTQKKDFTMINGTTIRIPMMNKLDTLPYCAAESFKAIKLPYGNGKYSMIVILPEKGFTTQNLISTLSAENWQSWMELFELTERVDVTMPRFKFTFETSLRDVLSKMGMQKAFLPKEADFSGISEKELYISEAKHKTYIDVNETGTEAAAVTSIGFSVTGIKEEPPVVPFLVDKPFLFAVTENETGALLFLGEVKNPEY